MSRRPKIQRIRCEADSACIEVSDRKRPLAVDRKVVSRYGLTEGVVLTTAQLAHLEQEAVRYRCDREVSRLLTLRDHTSGELREKLTSKGFPLQTVDSVIKEWSGRGMLDDSRMALNLADWVLKRKPCGRSFLVSCLQKRRVDRALAEQTADLVLKHHDEHHLAVQALRQRQRQLEEIDLETARRKAYYYLARRGFSYEASQAAFEQLVERTDEVTGD